MRQMTYANFRRTVVSKKRVKSYKAKTGKAPSNKQLIYWGRGYLKKRDIDLVYTTKPRFFKTGLWEHTLTWYEGYLNSVKVGSGRYVRLSQKKDDYDKEKMKYIVEVEEGIPIGWIGDDQQWGNYAVEQI